MVPPRTPGYGDLCHDFVCRCSICAGNYGAFKEFFRFWNWIKIGELPGTGRVTHLESRTHRRLPTMKTLKTVGAVAAALLLTALTIGANTAGSAARPTNVPSERWIVISPNAGFALNTNVSRTETAPDGGPPQQVVPP